MEVTIQLPDEVAKQLGDVANMPRQLLEAFAIENYRLEKLTRHQVSQLLGLDYWQTDELLAMHRAKHPYTLTDFEMDRASLAKLRARRELILVVADTGPLHYLVLIRTIDVLPRLYDRVVIPTGVHRELTHSNSPAAVKKWVSALPPWCEVRGASVLDATSVLGPGETEAIALAHELKADAVLLDDKAARGEAIRRGLLVTGTLGLLVDAAEQGLINLEEVFARLAGTTFYADPGLMEHLLARDAEGGTREERQEGGPDMTA